MCDEKAKLWRNIPPRALFPWCYFQNCAANCCLWWRDLHPAVRCNGDDRLETSSGFEAQGMLAIRGLLIAI